MDILLLEDDLTLGKQIVSLLNLNNFNTTWVKSHEAFLENFTKYDFYLIKLRADFKKAFELVKFIRENQDNSPVILLCEHLNPEIIKKAYCSGCDDLIKSPFLLEELLFKIFKLSKINYDNHYNITKNLYLDKNDSSVVINGFKIFLGKKEEKFLEILVKNRPNTVNFEQIEYYVWDGEYIKNERIRSMVRQLRAKLPCNIIQTVKGVGYKIDCC